MERTGSGNFRPSIRHRIPGLDELRGIAVLMVMVGHWAPIWPRLERGCVSAIGVDVFFIISGFLIGTILITSKGRLGYYRNFYIRRAFRILPLASVMVILGIVVSLITGRSTASLPYYLTLTQNFIPAYLSSGRDVDVLFPLVGTDPMWSLAVEEQVYMALPLLVAIMAGRPLGWLMAGVAAVGMGASVWAWNSHSGGGWYSNYTETWLRMQYIAFGVMMCVRDWWRRCPWLLVGWLVVTLLVVPWKVPQVPCVAAITWLIHGIKSGGVRFHVPMLAWIGVRCYGVYLLHYPVALAAKEVARRGWLHGGGTEVVALCCYGAITMLLAGASYRWFEQPIQRTRWHFETA